MRGDVVRRNGFVASTISCDEPDHCAGLIKQKSRTVRSDGVGVCSVLTVHTNDLLWLGLLNGLLVRLELRIWLKRRRKRVVVHTVSFLYISSENKRHSFSTAST